MAIEYRWTHRAAELHSRPGTLISLVSYGVPLSLVPILSEEGSEEL